MHPVTGAWERLTVSAVSPPADPPLPGPVNYAMSADATVTSLTRHTEVSPTSRVSLINPHTTRRLLVQATASCWMNWTTTSGGVGLYYDLEYVAGTAAQAQGAPSNVRMDLWSGMAAANWTGEVQGYFWVAAGATATFYVSACKTANATTYKVRGNRTVIAPIRYE
jgi:hypothetical protein